MFTASGPTRAKKHVRGESIVAKSADRHLVPGPRQRPEIWVLEMFCAEGKGK
jgi:hypothetical protein